MRRSILLAIASTVVLTPAFVLRAGSGAPSMADPAGSTPALSPITASVPVVEPGPLDVALRAVRLTGDIATAGFISRNDLIDSVASPRFASTLRANASAQLTEFTTAVGAAGVPPADVVWEELPLTARVVDHADMTVRVMVWSVLIVGVPGHGSARQVWRTSAITLVRTVDGWKVDDWSAIPGPTPTPAANGAVSDLPSIIEVLSWPPVAIGVN